MTTNEADVPRRTGEPPDGRAWAPGHMDAGALHRDAIVIDALDVSVMDRTHLEHMRAGGLTAANHTITLGDGHDFREAVDRILVVDDFLDANADLDVRSDLVIHQRGDEDRI